MPYRTFTDSAGTDWQVWDIVPRLKERREMPVPERRVEIVPIAFADRRRAERRVRHVARPTLRGAYAQGWLCFESDTEKRRVSPIPEDWTVCDEEKLEAYMRSGERAAATRQTHWYGDDDSLAEAG
jgi:hypothetical protein